MKNSISLNNFKLLIYGFSVFCYALFQTELPNVFHFSLYFISGYLYLYLFLTIIIIIKNEKKSEWLYIHKIYIFINTITMEFFYNRK